MQTIVLATANARYIHTSLGLRYLKANLREFAPITEIIEFSINEQPEDMAEAILRRLRLPKQVIEDVQLCVRNHMRFLEVRNMRQSTLRKMVAALWWLLLLAAFRRVCGYDATSRKGSRY